MNAVIYYCRTCGFQKPAEAAAAAFQREFGIETELKRAFWGTFRIEYGGQQIYNRWKAVGFWGWIGFADPATTTELVQMFRAHLNQPGPDNLGSRA